MSFRSFQTEQEEQRARALIASIDRGEAWIFDGAPNSPDFGGFIRRLVYSQGGHFGTLCICRFRGRLRIQLGFAPDVPKGAENELLGPILDIIRQSPGQVSLWYPPGNHRLHAWLQANIPWPLRGHSTFELTWPAGKSPESEDLPESLAIIDFEETYLEAVCTLLDAAMRHTFDDPEDRPFARDCQTLGAQWSHKAQSGQCALLLAKDQIAGFYALQEAEIDLIAIDPLKQGQGLGHHLLHHALNRILRSPSDPPHLYCIESNQAALRFYLREGFQITAHSAFAWFDSSK